MPWPSETAHAAGGCGLRGKGGVGRERGLQRMASEHFTAAYVWRATGSVLTNKYAEGYPGKRYYGGCEFVDVVETLAIERVKQLFDAPYANVQPHSGAQANMGVYLAMLSAGDTILGMSLAHGGHLTHGATVNFSGKLYKSVAYGLDPKTEEIDYDQVAAPAREHRPKMIVAGASASSLPTAFKRSPPLADAGCPRFLVALAHSDGAGSCVLL